MYENIMINNEIFRSPSLIVSTPSNSNKYISFLMYLEHYFQDDL